MAELDAVPALLSPAGAGETVDYHSTPDVSS